MQIDGVTTPAGLFVARKTWTLANAADGFWMVHVGWAIPGERRSRPTIWSRVDADDLSAVAADRRSRFVPWRKIRSARVRMHAAGDGDAFPIVRLHGVRTRQLEFRGSDRDTVVAFFEPIEQLFSRHR